MFHGTLRKNTEPRHRAHRFVRSAVLLAALVTGALWTAQASADITVILSSDNHDRHHHRYDRHDRYDRHGRYNNVDLIGSLLMPGSARYYNNGHSRHDRHKHNGRYDRPRHPHARHSHHREFSNGNRGRWDSNRHREIIYVEKDARHRGNYRDVERRSVIIRRRDR